MTCNLTYSILLIIIYHFLFFFFLFRYCSRVWLVGGGEGEAGLAKTKEIGVIEWRDCSERADQMQLIT